MSKTVVVAGTATGIGKTWVAARLAEALRARGTRVAARKPVQSFAPGEGPTDAEILAAASGEEPYEVCPEHRWYPLAMAPPMAADALDLPAFKLAELVGEIALPDEGICLIEGVGGPRSPLAADGDTIALAEALRPDLVVLVADAELGTINATRLSIDAFGARASTVYLNRYDAASDLHRRNREWLEDSGIDLTVDIEDLAARLDDTEVAWTAEG